MFCRHNGEQNQLVKEYLIDQLQLCAIDTYSPRSNSLWPYYKPLVLHICLSKYISCSYAAKMSHLWVATRQDVTSLGKESINF